MDLKTFLSSRYNSKTFESFIKERFYGLDIYDSSMTDEQLNESERKSIDAYKFLGKAELDDGKEIGFFEFKATSPHLENKRVGYNAILKKLAYDEYLDGAIASFYHPESHAWRLSFVGFEYDEGKAKVTNLKRFTYVLGEDIPIKTPFVQLKNLKYPNFNEIEEAFSVEAVTDDFYKSYKALFESINEELEPQKAIFTGKEEPEIEIRKFSRKLLGRITFIYFLQKKGWLGVKSKWGDGDKNFLQNILKTCDGNFYYERLTPLFFAALNTIREDDYFADLDCKIPFLNGGLFTKESYDKEEIILSNELFEKIFETFNQYNFTIIEDLPHDSEVAIDPEMLGRVFENLIEENYRKGKGAFYTPREIVHYMCKQSIIMYLSNYFEQEYIEKLVNNEVTDESYIKNNATQIREKLLAMKVLDPAIGSGAFPMGILHEMVQIIGNLNKADNPSKEKKLIIENSIYGVDIDGSAVDIAKLRFWLSIIVDEEEPFPLPNLAFKIMQGNSLIETIDGFSPIPEDIYEQKKTQAISLFEDEEQSLFDESKFELLKQNIHAFYNASNTAKKKELENKIKSQIQEIVCGYIDLKEKELKARTKDFDNTLKTSTREKLWNEMDRLQNSIEKARKIIDDMLTNNFQTTELFLYKLWFGEVIKDGGFDIVIGNPPYVKEYTNKDAFRGTYDLECYQGKMDIWYLFGCKGIDLLKNRGILSFIATNNWISNFGASKLRKKVLNAMVMKEFIDFGNYKVFDTAGIQTMILLAIKDSNNENYNCKYSRINSDYLSNKELDNFLEKQTNDKFTIFNALIDKNALINKNITFLDSNISMLLNKIESNRNFNLKSKDEVAQGIVTPNDNVTKKSLEVLGEGYTLHEGIFNLTTEEKLNLQFSDSEKELIKPLYTTKEIERYKSNKENEYWVIYTDSSFKDIKKIKNFPNIKNHLDRFASVITSSNKPYGIHRARNEYFFKEKKILSLRKCVNRPQFSYVDFDTYVNQAFYIIKSEKINLKYLTSLLNSKLVAFWLRYKGKMQGNNYQVDKEPILNIPIKNIENTDIFEILVDYVMWLKAHTESIDNYVDNEHIAKLFEDVIDAMVLELYFKKEMKEAGFDFIAHATELFKSIENLSDSETKGIINNAYQSLREKDNPIRNDLQLLPIRVPMVAPILESI